MKKPIKTTCADCGGDFLWVMYLYGEFDGIKIPREEWQRPVCIHCFEAQGYTGWRKIDRIDPESEEDENKTTRPA